MVDISIVIVAYNNEQDLPLLLSMIEKQRIHLTYEIIGMVTESEDNTEAIIRESKAKVFIVNKSDFHHIRTRIDGVRHSTGKFIVFIVGDATPYNEYWLNNLVKPLIEDSSAAASYSRQFPKAKCPPWEARDIYAGVSSVRRTKNVDFSDPHQVEIYSKNIWEFIMFSDVSSCYRRELLEKYPFNEKLDVVEDQEWCKRAIENGYAIIFEPTSIVIHSHNESIKTMYERHFKYGRAFATFLNLKSGRYLELVSHVFYDTILDFVYITHDPAPWWKRVHWVLKAPIVRSVKTLGYNQGIKSVRQREIDG